MDFEQDIRECLRVLRAGGLILYPTDTIWGIGCDATSPEAVAQLLALKKRQAGKSLIILLPDARDLFTYVAAPDPAVFDFLEEADRPVSIIYPQALGLAENVPADDGSVGIRIVKEPFCFHLLKRFRKPLVSTSANLSGEPAPRHFGEISDRIRQGVGYIVQYRQSDRSPATPSTLIRWRGEGQYELVRE